MAYTVYGSKYAANTHDIHFHVTGEPVAADNCGPICDERLFDRGVYDAKSTSDAGMNLFADFVLKTQGNMKRDPTVSGGHCFLSDRTLTSHLGT